MWDQPLKPKRRFDLQLPVAFSWMGARGRDTASGAVIEMSSNSALLAGSETPPHAALVLASVEWPVALEDGCRLRLFVYGRVVMAGDCLFEITIDRYEFRTARRDGPAPMPRLDAAVSSRTH